MNIPEWFVVLVLVSDEGVKPKALESVLFSFVHFGAALYLFFFFLRALHNYSQSSTATFNLTLCMLAY